MSLRQRLAHLEEQPVAPDRRDHGRVATSPQLQAATPRNDKVFAGLGDPGGPGQDGYAPPRQGKAQGLTALQGKTKDTEVRAARVTKDILETEGCIRCYSLF